MRTFTYVEPTSATDPTPRVVTLTENEILATYYPWWNQQMSRAGHTVGLTPLACVEDWCVVHWC
jgi:hypothetical protein